MCTHKNTILVYCFLLNRILCSLYSVYCTYILYVLWYCFRCCTHAVLYDTYSVLCNVCTTVIYAFIRCFSDDQSSFVFLCGCEDFLLKRCGFRSLYSDDG